MYVSTINTWCCATGLKIHLKYLLLCQWKLTMQMQGLAEWQTAEWVQRSSTVVQRLMLIKSSNNTVFDSELIYTT